MSKKMLEVDKYYSILYKKHKRVIRRSVIINLTIFVLTASLVVLNLFAIRWNPSDHSTTRWLFVAVAILSGLGGFISTIMSIYVFRRNSKAKSVQIEKIKDQYKLFKKKEGAYSGRDREQVLISNITEITTY